MTQTRLFLSTAIVEALLLSLAPAPAFACSAPASVFYVNGINNTLKVAEASRIALDSVVRQDTAQGCIPPSVSLNWNRTRRFVGDLFQAFTQTLVDVADHDGDLLDHLKNYRTEINLSRKVIIVGHSQGNLYANKAYSVLMKDFGSATDDHIGVVAVASPSDHVGAAGRTTPSITLFEDDIASVIFPLAIAFVLPPNTTNRPNFQCSGFVGCHSFGESYLSGQTSREKILTAINQLLPLPAAVNITGTVDGVAWNGLVSYSIVGPIGTTTGGAVPGGAPHWPAGQYTVTYLSGGPSSALFSGVSPQATQTVAPGGSITFSLNFQTQPPPPNQRPTAGFSMSADGQSASAGQTLTIDAAAETGEGVVIFTDKSTDADGTIATRVWTTNTPCVPGGTPPCLLSSVRSFTWGFRPGSYTVTLQVTDDDGASATASGVVVVLPPPVVEGPWSMDGRNSLRQSLSATNGPLAAPTTPTWIFQTGGSIVGSLALSAQGHVYAASDQLYALNPDGSIYAQALLPPATQTQPNPAFLTGPAIDEQLGFVYIAVTSPAGGWDVIRFNKDLAAPVTVAHGTQAFNPVSSIIIDRSSAVFFVGGQAYSRGAANWDSDACAGNTPIGPGWGAGWGSNAPTFGPDGSLYGVCQVAFPGSIFGAALLKLDPSTGSTAKHVFYQLGAREIMADDQGLLHVGWQQFGGVVFGGGYDTFDSELVLVASSYNGDYTSGRAALLPDGISTVRIGFSFQDSRSLSARGAVQWDVYLTSPDYFTTNPSVDATGRVFIGSTSGLHVLRSADGSTEWTFGGIGEVTTQPVIHDGAVYFATSNGSTYRLDAGSAPPPSPNQPPSAGFSMSDGAQTVSNGQTLSVAADPTTGEAAVTFTDASTDTDGTIATRRWTTNTGCTPTEPPPCVLSTAASFTWRFQPGQYTVTLDVADDDGDNGTASGQVHVDVPANWGNLETWFDGATDSRLLNAWFGEPKVDESGNVWVLSRHQSANFGSIDIRLNKINPSAQLVFQSGILHTSALAVAHLTIGPADRVYVWTPGRVDAFHHTGALVGGGWPVDAIGSEFAGPPAIDPINGNVVLKLGTTLLGLDMNGVELWRKDYPDGAAQFPVVLGPNRNAYTILDNGSGSPSLDRQRLVGIDRDSTGTGVSVCTDLGLYGPMLAFIGSFFGDATGAFASIGGGITRYNDTCDGTGIFVSSTTAAQVVLSGVGEDWVLASECRRSSALEGCNETNESLIGISADGAITWTNSDVLLDPPIDVYISSVWNISGGLAYATGRDKTDSLARKLFVVELSSGSTLGRFDLSSMCAQCGVDLGVDGTIYVAGVGSARIGRLVPSVSSGALVSRVKGSRPDLGSRRSVTPNSR